MMIRLRHEWRRINIKDHPNYLSKEIQYGGITKSPKTTEYRNNNEYTCGRNKENQIEIGFQEGSYKNGTNNVYVKIETKSKVNRKQ
jgi:hypothetical protein